MFHESGLGQRVGKLTVTPSTDGVTVNFYDRRNKYHFAYKYNVDKAASPCT